MKKSLSIVLSLLLSFSPTVYAGNRARAGQEDPSAQFTSLESLAGIDDKKAYIVDNRSALASLSFGQQVPGEGQVVPNNANLVNLENLFGVGNIQSHENAWESAAAKVNPNPPDVSELKRTLGAATAIVKTGKEQSIDETRTPVPGKMFKVVENKTTKGVSNDSGQTSTRLNTAADQATNFVGNALNTSLTVPRAIASPVTGTARQVRSAVANSDFGNRVSGSVKIAAGDEKTFNGVEVKNKSDTPVEVDIKNGRLVEVGAGNVTITNTNTTGRSVRVALEDTLFGANSYVEIGAGGSVTINGSSINNVTGNVTIHFQGKGTASPTLTLADGMEISVPQGKKSTWNATITLNNSQIKSISGLVSIDVSNVKDNEGNIQLNIDLSSFKKGKAELIIGANQTVTLPNGVTVQNTGTEDAKVRARNGKLTEIESGNVTITNNNARNRSIRVALSDNFGADSYVEIGKGASVTITGTNISASGSGNVKVHFKGEGTDKLPTLTLADGTKISVAPQQGKKKSTWDATVTLNLDGGKVKSLEVNGPVSIDVSNAKDDNGELKTDIDLSDLEGDIELLTIGAGQTVTLDNDIKVKNTGTDVAKISISGQTEMDVSPFFFSPWGGFRTEDLELFDVQTITTITQISGSIEVTNNGNRDIRLDLNDNSFGKGSWVELSKGAKISVTGTEIDASNSAGEVRVHFEGTGVNTPKLLTKDGEISVTTNTRTVRGQSQTNWNATVTLREGKLISVDEGKITLDVSKVKDNEGNIQLKIDLSKSNGNMQVILGANQELTLANGITVTGGTSGTATIEIANGRLVGHVSGDLKVKTDGASQVRINLGNNFGANSFVTMKKGEAGTFTITDNDTTHRLDFSQTTTGKFRIHIEVPANGTSPTVLTGNGNVISIVDTESEAKSATFEIEGREGVASLTLTINGKIKITTPPLADNPPPTDNPPSITTPPSTPALDINALPGVVNNVNSRETLLESINDSALSDADKTKLREEFNEFFVASDEVAGALAGIVTNKKGSPEYNKALEDLGTALHRLNTAENNLNSDLSNISQGVIYADIYVDENNNVVNNVYVGKIRGEVDNFVEPFTGQNVSIYIVDWNDDTLSQDGGALNGILGLTSSIIHDENGGGYENETNDHMHLGTVFVNFDEVQEVVGKMMEDYDKGNVDLVNKIFDGAHNVPTDPAKLVTELTDIVIHNIVLEEGTHSMSVDNNFLDTNEESHGHLAQFAFGNPAYAFENMKGHAIYAENYINDIAESLPDINSYFEGLGYAAMNLGEAIDFFRAIDPNFDYSYQVYQVILDVATEVNKVDQVLPDVTTVMTYSEAKSIINGSTTDVIKGVAKALFETKYGTSQITSIAGIDLGVIETALSGAASVSSHVAMNISQSFTGPAVFNAGWSTFSGGTFSKVKDDEDDLFKDLLKVFR